jgi:hypothetical protein
MFHSRPARKVRAYRPCLEVLEDRNLLSTWVVDRLTNTYQGSGMAGDLYYCVDHAAAGDTVTFGVTGEIQGNLQLSQSIHIQGPGAHLLTLEPDGGWYGLPIVEVEQDTSVTIDGLTIDGLGGTYYQYPPFLGGGICNYGTLTVSNCAVRDCLVRGYGGGIFNGGQLTVTNSEISGNVALMTGDSRDGGLGGGIANDWVDFYEDYYPDATVTICNSTIAYNSASWFGGAISSEAYSLAQHDGGVSGTNCTVADNSSDQLHYEGHTFISLSNSLVGSSSALGLGPLQYNGGPTRTKAPLPGSPALNTGDPYQLGVPDQRGVVRSGGVNRGAFQASASILTLTGLPSSAVAGTALTGTLTAKDSFGQTAVGYTGTVHFGSTDGQAALAGNYAFTLGDAGTHVFTNGFTLQTAGNQTVTAADMATASLTGSASVAVSPAAADHLLFVQQPTDTPAGQTISAVIVVVVDAFGNVETNDNTDTITLSIGINPSGGTLSGTLTLTVANGVATFGDLSIDQAGVGYTLHATIGGGLSDIDSDPFNVTT